MEPTTPVRALVTTGAAMMIMFGGGAAPVLGTTAAADQSPTPTVRHSSIKQAEPLEHTEVLGRKKKRKKAGRSATVYVSGRYTRSVNVRSLGAVNAAYKAQFASGLNVPTEYSGDANRCVAGNSTPQSRAATHRAVNFVRSLAGLAPVSFSEDLNNRAQQTAMMMAANRKLSHTPTRNWRCYTGTGAANAGRSNLVLSYPRLTAAGLVRLYTDDPGASNAAVGHRRWLLNPFATAMGSGSTREANAITVIGPSSRYRPNPTWVAWPSPGYFPNALEPNGRWSISAGNPGANFRKAKVRVFRNGRPVRAVKARVVNGYAQPTLVWHIPASQAKTGTYRVVVKGVKIGKKRFQTTYNVSMFTPR